LAIATFASLAAVPTAASSEGGSGSSPVATYFPLRFDSEWIRLSVQGDSIEVHGTYVLLCRSGKEQPITLFYPFPRDSLLGGARMVSLHVKLNAGDARPMEWEEVARGVSGVRWHVPPCAGDTIEIEAEYRQKTVPGYLRYIVTTTRAWERPLRRARFDVRLPSGASSPVFTFPFRRQDEADGAMWTFEAVEFFPDKDIVVRWQP
jgi:hypothetical protein